MTNFGIGRVLATGFRVWASNFVSFTLLAAIVYLPLLLWGFSVAHSEYDPTSFQRYLQFSGIGTAVLGILVSAAVTYGVVMELMGERASMGACIATGIRRFFPALLTAILSAILVFLGSLAFVIPGLILMCMFYVVAPVAVLERQGIAGALGRSRELTRGHRWKIFGLIFVMGLAQVLVTVLISSLTLPNRAEGLEAFEAAFPKYMYVSMIETVVLGALNAVMLSVAYYYLRAEKEGTSARELAMIFD